MIYIVEDDANIQKLVCYALSKEGYEIKGFSDPCGFWQEFDKDNAQLVLLDIMLPGEDGLSVLQKLQADKDCKNIPIIILSAKASEFDKVTGLDMGADDYIAKPFGMTELISRVRAVLRRYEKTNLKNDYRIGNLYVNPKKHIITVDGDKVSLSFKEYSLLIQLLEAEGNVVSRDALLAKVWGEYYEESRTLDVHIRKLRKKLGAAGELLKTVKNIGYKLEGKENVQ